MCIERIQNLEGRIGVIEGGGMVRARRNKTVTPSPNR